MNKHLTLDNIYKIASTLGLICILYLNLHYVSMTTFDEHVKMDVETHIKISETLYNISTSVALMQRSDLILSDHETRIREIERKTAAIK